MEYFSNIDPLYRSYGKQEALRRQQAYFKDASTEPAWLDYNCRFANAANWMKHASNPFGDPREAKTSQRRFTIARGRKNGELHDRWRAARSRLRGFCDPVHPFVHRGEGKAYTYKLFLEQAYACCREGGRIGFVVPSGLYSDDGTSMLRVLLLEQCRWGMTDSASRTATACSQSTEATSSIRSSSRRGVPPRRFVPPSCAATWTTGNAPATSPRPTPWHRSNGSAPRAEPCSKSSHGET